VRAVLGGAHTGEKSEGALLTAIVNPPHDLAEGFDRSSIESGTKSRMGDYARVTKAG
jgi:hypothetical protein